jgi:5-methylcytosine-specific restriction endonuclease McrA
MRYRRRKKPLSSKSVSQLYNLLHKTRAVIRDLTAALREPSGPQLALKQGEERIREIEATIKRIYEEDYRSQPWYKKVFECRLSPEASWRVHQLQQEIAKVHDQNKHYQDLLSQKFHGFALHEVGLMMAKTQEAEIVKAIPEAEKREQRQRRKAGADDLTIAIAAAHLEKTRDLAEKVKKSLIRQFEIIPYCPYCGGPFSGAVVADHIYPVSHGGLSVATNMVFICWECNSKKTDLTLRQFIKKFNLNQNEIELRLDRLGKKY